MAFKLYILGKNLSFSFIWYVDTTARGIAITKLAVDYVDFIDVVNKRTRDQGITKRVMT